MRRRTLLRRSAALTAGLLFASFALVYLLAAPSLAHQHWDSLDYAHRVETSAWPVLWGNHPLGHLLQFILFHAARAIGYAGRALPLLQSLGAIAAAAAVAAFYQLLTGPGGRDRVRATGWSVVLGTSYGVQHYAGTADIYGIALLLLVVAWLAVARVPDRDHRLSITWAGGLVGLAALAHQFNAVLMAVALLAAWRRNPGISVRVATVALIAMAGGYVALGLVSTGAAAPADIFAWMRGYGADPTYGGMPTEASLRLGLLTIPQAVLGAGRSPAQGLAQAALLVVPLALLIAGAIASARAARQRSTTGLAAQAAAQAAAGAVLILWWEPGNAKFWVLVLPAIVVVMDAGLPRAPRWRAAPMVMALSWLAFNLPVNFANESRADDAFEHDLSAITATSTRDDVIVEGGRYTAHLLYWADRPRTVNLFRALQASPDHADPFANIRATMADAWRRGSSVLYIEGLARYYTPERLATVGTTPEEGAAFFAGYAKSDPIGYVTSESGARQAITRVLPRYDGDDR